MIPESLLKLEQQLRLAAETQHYDDVQRASAALCQAVESHLITLRAGDPDVSRIADRLSRTLDRTLLLMLAARAACADELRRISKLNGYLRPVETPSDTIRLDL